MGELSFKYYSLPYFTSGLPEALEKFNEENEAVGYRREITQVILQPTMIVILYKEYSE